MAQDNPNDPVTPTAQSAEPSANAFGVELLTAATLVIDDSAANADESAMDDAEDEMPDAESEESENGRGEASPSEPASSANEVATLQADAPSAKSEAGTDDRSEIEQQPYDLNHCTVQIAIQLLPDDGNANGRMVVVGVRSHLDAPILRLMRLNELGALPPFVTTLLDELKADLPNRAQAAREAFEKKKAEQAKRKSAISASRMPQDKKNARATSLSTAPSADAPTDTQPRPAVNVPTNSQQQIGLF